ncbi:MAG: sulfurtransferase TusA family protein [Alphaproteobacteria bacterium]|nr:sulfurtransferase TusA family protein [Alphaproteobacteria bacterium]MCB9929879.1 sulfurtransferase TusA family protein [Alphaproteobacteria bacterium]
MADQTLDATGLKCPMPVLRARRALKALPSGAVLELLADDPASAKDVPAFCEMTGDALEETRQDGGTFTFLIRKA